MLAIVSNGVNYILLDGQLVWSLYIYKWASTIVKGQNQGQLYKSISKSINYYQLL